MHLRDEVLNRALFDERTHAKWQTEVLEAFVCTGCEQVFVGVPDSHALLIDGNDPSSQLRYNQPQGTRCPNCNAVLQGDGQSTRDPSPEELRRSPWRWIVRSAHSTGTTA